MTTIVLPDPFHLAVVARAMETGHKITCCALCGGPEVHSKIHAVAKCFRCGASRETPFVCTAGIAPSVPSMSALL